MKSDGTYQVKLNSTYKSSIKTVVIPEEYNGIAVTSVGSFANAPLLSTVVLPNSITSIANSAFYGCTSLKSITIPASVTSIGTRVFHESGIQAVIFEDTQGWVRKHAWVGSDNVTWQVANLKDISSDITDPAVAAEILLSAETKAVTVSGTSLTIYYSFSKS